ncbi:c-type cytochrome (plasmid) [Deinococcus radiomollis]|uniref:c-type cytochrome n=1 Tax=Deinococcus radiomollis TaxID=468916 RepID=UPI00389188FD
MKQPYLLGLLIPLGALAVTVPLVAMTFTPDTSPLPASSNAVSAGTTTELASAKSAPVPVSAPAASSSAGDSVPVQYAEQMRGVIDQAAATPYTTDASYSIGTIPQDTPPLIEGQGVELVRTNCSVCHATTFISSQPPLPGSTWHDEVYKMKEKYGATFISDDNANKIIAYLSAHYTPETHKPGSTSEATPAVTAPLAVKPAAKPSAATSAAVDGAKVYAANCSSCHGASGAGVPGAFPPLAGNTAITGDSKYISDVLLYGLQGKIVARGQPYNGVMPAWAAQLNDAQIAAVATHVRSTWGNKGSAVSAATVKIERSTPKTVVQILKERPQ